MKLIITGCEYAGKSTLINEIKKWANNALGGLQTSCHDHFTLGGELLPEDIKDSSERDKLLALGPKAKEMYQRYMIEYHLAPFEGSKDHIVVGFHIEEAVYAPLYYGYGKPREYGDRSWFARHIDTVSMKYFPVGNPALLLIRSKSRWCLHKD